MRWSWGDVPRRVAAFVMAMVLVGCSGGAPADGDGADATPTAEASSPTEQSPSPDSAGVAGDLDALAQAFERSHPEPPDDLDARIADVAPTLDGASDEQVLVELMRLTAGRDRDGHTGVFPLAQPELEIWPVQLYAFADGWRVVAAQDERLVGREVTAIGGRPVDEVADLVAPLVPRDTDASLLGRLPQYLVVPAVLRGLGIEPTLELDGETMALTPIDVAAYADWGGLFDPLVCPPLPRDTPAWSVDERGDAVVVSYRRVTSTMDGTTVADLATELREAVAASDPAAIVLDVRDNPGGDNGTYPPLLDALTDLAGQYPATLRVLVSRCTFSAATNLVMQVLEQTDAVTVGETMGGSPALWGDPRILTLPESGTVVHVATRWWELGGRPDLAVLEPDVEVPVTWEDHHAGRDPALDAATHAETPGG